LGDLESTEAKTFRIPGYMLQGDFALALVPYDTIDWEH
jgi:hypothetical protein